MKISNWLFRWWYVMKLKQQRNSPFKMKNETDALKSNCIAEIQNETESFWYSIKRLVHKLGVKSIQNNRSRIYRDEFGIESILPNPVFSDNQIALIKSKDTSLKAVIIFFSISESFLYYLTASLFVPGGAEYMKISVAIFLALLIMFALNYAFGKHFIYREAIEKHGKNEISVHEMKKFRDMRNLGYLIIVLSFSAIIFAGISRVFFLEHIPTAGLSTAKANSVQKASDMASYFTLLITIIAAIFMALIKQDQSKYSNKYKVYKSWKSAHIKGNTYIQGLIKDANALIVTAEHITEKYWQLVVDLKRIYKMDTEYDIKYEDLHKEFMKAQSSNSFVITESLYRKYAPIQCSNEELFKFGIYNDKRLKEKIDFCVTILSLPEDHIKEHLQTLMQNEKPQLSITPFSSNGKLRHDETKIVKNHEN